MTLPVVAVAGLEVARDGVTVLRDVSFTLLPGERLAITGANGAGKTTLLRAIAGLDRPVAGTVRLFGTACRSEEDFRRFRPRLGFLFQDSDDQLFCPTVAEDVAFGPLNLGQTPAEARATATVVLDRLNLAHLADRAIHRLSGGEKRLVALAGILAMQPEVLLLDEPTSGIDGQNAARLAAEIGAFSGSLILVSHDSDFVADTATRHLFLDQGRLSAIQRPDGRPCLPPGENPA